MERSTRCRRCAGHAYPLKRDDVGSQTSYASLGATWAQVRDLGRLAAQGDPYGLLALGQQLVEGRAVAQDHQQVVGSLLCFSSSSVMG